MSPESYKCPYISRLIYFINVCGVLHFWIIWCLTFSQMQGISAISKNIFAKMIGLLFSASRKLWSFLKRIKEIGLRVRQEFTIGSCTEEKKKVQIRASICSDREIKRIWLGVSLTWIMAFFKVSFVRYLGTLHS